MGILQWLKNFGNAASDASGESPPPLPVGAEERIGTLNLQQAFTAHMNWRKRLEGILNGTNEERPEVGTVSMDGLCDLGKWLHGEGKARFQISGKPIPEFSELMIVHREFHLCAGEILSRFNRGENESAAKYLRSEFRTASDRVQLALAKLYAHANG